jgi:acyl-CoA reductase-like NAD-dependent aldehyde dehydrogenase
VTSSGWPDRHGDPVSPPQEDFGMPDPLPLHETPLARSYARLRDAWTTDGGLSIAQRCDVLRTLRASLRKRADDYVAAISADFRGRSKHETLLTEIAVVISAIDYTLPRIRRWARPSSIALGWPIWPARGGVIPQPRGVVGVVAPSNYPLQLALMPLVSAIAAGCRVLIKPSEMTPRTAQLIAQHIEETFDPSIVGVVCGDAEIAAQFVRLPFDALLFTGSHRTGAKVAAAAASNMTPLILELGGKSPVIIDRGADVAKAAKAIMAGKLMNAGQTCVAPDYVLVARENVDALVAELKAAAQKLYPDREARDYTAILSNAAIARLEALESPEQTVNLLDSDIVAPRYKPKLLLSPARDRAAMTEEVFGPLLSILAYETIDEAIEIVRSQPPALVIYWFGDTNARFDAMMAKTMSGAVSVNETVLHAGISALPFGGVGRSGIGRYHGKAGFDAFSNERVIFKQSRWSLTHLLRPPFGKRADRILRQLLG